MANEFAYDDAWIREVSKPYANRIPLPKVPFDAWHQWQSSNKGRMQLWFWHVGTQTQSSLMLTSLALHAYKLDHGSYPSSLAQLAPAYLESLPADPFAPSGTFKYRRIGNKYLLYSVGPDGKDDGGKPIYQSENFGPGDTESSYNIIEMGSTGDIVAGVNEML